MHFSEAVPGLDAVHVPRVLRAAKRKLALPSVGFGVPIAMEPGDGRPVLSVQRVDREAALEVVFENMAHAVAMFDGDGRLIACNRRYGLLYGLSDEETRPGTTFHLIHARLVKLGLVSDDPTAYLNARARQTNVATADIEFADGRTIALHLSPLPNGGWISTAADVTDKRRMARELAYLATQDRLTGLSNRTSFVGELQKLAARSSSSRRLALHLIDLDGFKGVNDGFGHPTGDEVLKVVAERLRQIVRSSDVVGRLGGDEFAIIQTGVTRTSQAQALAKRVVAELSRPFLVHSTSVWIGASVGTAFAPSDAVDAARLLKQSDLALYSAKADGRGRHELYEPHMEASDRSRHQLTAELRNALGRGEFELFYQPTFDLFHNRVSGFEALIRWHHPSRGFLKPAEFIGVAETSGLITQIGTWALRQACRDASAWSEDIKVAVNVSPSQCSEGLIGYVTSALLDSGLPANRLELEFTESALLHNSLATQKALADLRAQGVGIVMDDFGTGYSSLSYLLSFPFSKIKIDRSFIASCGEKQGRAIIHATVVLADGLGIATTAEGVETAEQLDYLRWEGCTEAQGYLVCQPVPANRVADVIASLLADQERWSPKPITGEPRTDEAASNQTSAKGKSGRD